MISLLLQEGVGLGVKGEEDKKNKQIYAIKPRRRKMVNDMTNTLKRMIPIWYHQIILKLTTFYLLLWKLWWRRLYTVRWCDWATIGLYLWKSYCQIQTRNWRKEWKPPYSFRYEFNWILQDYKLWKAEEYFYGPDSIERSMNRRWISSDAGVMRWKSRRSCWKRKCKKATDQVPATSKAV